MKWTAPTCTHFWILFLSEFSPLPETTSAAASLTLNPADALKLHAEFMLIRLGFELMSVLALLVAMAAVYCFEIPVVKF